jgi:hypothetical protein
MFETTFSGQGFSSNSYVLYGLIAGQLQQILVVPEVGQIIPDRRFPDERGVLVAWSEYEFVAGVDLEYYDLKITYRGSGSFWHQENEQEIYFFNGKEYIKP